MKSENTIEKAYKTRQLFGWFFVFFVMIAAPSLIRIALREGIQPREAVDTESYRATEVTVIGLLGGIRTPVYPIFLKATALIGDSRLVAIVQLLLYIIPLSVCSVVLIGSRVPPWAVCTLCVPFCSATVVTEYFCTILPETCGAAAAFSVLLLTISGYSSKGTIRVDVAMSLLAFTAILSKPQYLFLIPFLFVACLVRMATINHVGSWKRRLRGVAESCLVYVSPVLAYCLLRWVVVGHFGLVSFGGANLAGLLLNPLFLDRSLVQSLEAGEDRDAAACIVLRRETLLDRSETEPDLRTEDPNVRVRDALDAARLRRLPLYDAISVAYNANMWDVARPALMEFYRGEEAGGDQLVNVRIDGMLGRLSMLVLKKNVISYMRWIGLATAEAFNRMVRYDTWNGRILALACAVWIVVFLTHGGVAWYIESADNALCRAGGILAVGVSVAVFFGKVVGLMLGLWAWVPGTIAPVLVPFAVLVFGVWYAGVTALWVMFGCRGKSTCSFLSYVVCCCSAYVAFGVCLIVAVELPLDRYLMTISPVATAGSVLVIGCAVLKRVSSLRGLLGWS